ncbi:glycosyltransferase family 39 protein [Candidatus Gottesmanbacteria bacterium]|nr:glycosyltransferase family 39 protein [Candidatus Gottesmanbacteria bacterium]
MKKIDYLIILFIISASVIVLKDLFKPGMYTSHDGIHQVVRFYYFDQILREGQIPPRWVGGLMNGFGYPLFIFSYQLPWFIAEVIHNLGSSIIDSVKMTFLVGFAISGITMYLFQKDIFGRLPAFAGTALYLISPYRFSNIFVRGAIGDATAFIFAPLLFWAFFHLKSSWSWRWIAIGAGALVGLILSHVMVTALFMSSLIIYLIFFLATIKDKLSFLKSFLSVILLGSGISAYYLIPSLVEKSNTQFQSLMSQIFIGSYFPTISELIYSKWGYGVFHSKEGAMSLQVGLTGWFVVFMTLIGVIFLPLLYRKTSKPEVELFVSGRIILVIFAFTIFMMLPASLPIWKIISPVVFVDFPWRYLAVITFFVSLCAGLLIALIKRFEFILTLFLILSALYFNRNHLRINETLGWDLPFMLKLERTTNSFDEYKPKWVKEEFIKEKKPRIEFSDSNAKITINKVISNYQKFTINNKEDGKVRVNTIYYPGWELFVNGKSKVINYQSTGLIEFDLDSGNSEIILKFVDTPLRKLSNALSLFSIGILLFGFIKYRKV